MKKAILLLIIFVIVKGQAQNYQISFTGTGASTKVDSVIVQNLSQCKSLTLKGSDILNLTITTGINELGYLQQAKYNGINVFPNPVSGKCLIEFEASGEGMTTVELYDIAGKIIAKSDEYLIKGQHSYSLSGTGSGIYVVKVKSVQYSYSSRIISLNPGSGIIELKHISSDNNSNKDSLVSKTGIVKSLKSDKSLIEMQYSKGDTLKFKGFSGIYSTVAILVPSKSTTYSFDFTGCTDGDNNNYSVVQIGSQTWMAENLKTTRLNDGTAITLPADSAAWGNLLTPGYCWYNDSIKYKNILGGLYNWYAANNGNLCPTGWHVPDTAEWNTLINYLGGGYNYAGGKMKDPCSPLWISPNANSTNSSGFTGLPGGNRSVKEAYYSLGKNSYWWVATKADNANAYYCLLYDNYPEGHLEFSLFKYGFSIRCIK